MVVTLPSMRMKTALVALMLLALAQCSLASQARGRNERRELVRDSLLDRLSVGQQIETVTGAVNTIEAVLDNTHAARVVALRQQDQQQQKQERIVHHIPQPSSSDSGSGSGNDAGMASSGSKRGGTSRTVSAKRKTKDGGSTSVIANRNFMSITEDQDGNPMPPNLSDAEKNLAEAEETVKRSQIKTGPAMPSLPTSSAASAASGTTGSTKSANSALSALSAMAPSSGNTDDDGSESPASVSSYQSPASSLRFRSLRNNQQQQQQRVATKANTQQTRSQAATKHAAAARTRTVRRVIRRVVARARRVGSAAQHQQTHTRTLTVNRNQAESQASIEKATRDNALAEVEEALEGAAKTNERNARHDEMKVKQHQRQQMQH